MILDGSFFSWGLFLQSIFSWSLTMALNVLYSLVCFLLFGRLSAGMEDSANGARCRGDPVLPVCFGVCSC